MSFRAECTHAAWLRSEFTDQLAAVNSRIDRIISETSTQIGTLRGGTVNGAVYNAGAVVGGVFGDAVELGSDDVADGWVCKQYGS